MAKTIEPISSWQSGEEKQATVFVLTSSFDNLSTSATFQYQLNEVVTAPMPPYPSPVYPMLNALVNSSLNISGQDYIDWDAASDANEWAYNWAASQLKLVITGEYIPTYPTTTTTTILPTTTLAP